MDHKQVRFDPDLMLNDPPVFAEMPIDYNSVEMNPQENPLYIQHALLNKGSYPPQFSADLDRYM